MKKNKKKECFIYGNTKSKEIAVETLFSDENGNDCIDKQVMCKEGYGCS